MSRDEIKSNVRSLIAATAGTWDQASALLRDGLLEELSADGGAMVAGLLQYCDLVANSKDQNFCTVGILAKIKLGELLFEISAQLADGD